MYIKGFSLKTFGNEREGERESQRVPEIPKEIETIPPLGATNDKRSLIKLPQNFFKKKLVFTCRIYGILHDKN